MANENSKGSKEGCGCPWASVMVMVMGGGVLVADRSYLNFTSWVLLPPFLLPPCLRGQERRGVGDYV